MTEIAIAAAPGEERMGFFTDTTTCIGCKACEVACKQWNDLPSDGGSIVKGGSYDHTGSLGASTWRHVRFVEVLAPEVEPEPPAIDPEDVDLLAVASGATTLSRWVFMSDVCKHCTNAGCLDACPTGALIRTEFETVIVQPDICNGCGYCIPSCPFGVIDRAPDDGRAAKCTLCYDRLEDGLEPACAKACPTDSIQFGPREELLARAEDRVATLHGRGVESAYLYGADEGMAGGLGAFFLLTEAPERYGLPAAADSPIQQQVGPATAMGMVAGTVAAVAVAITFARKPRAPHSNVLAGLAVAGMVTDGVASRIRKRRRSAAA